MISVMFKDSYGSGYGVAGTNIYNIVKSKYPGCIANRNISSGINIFVSIPPFNLEKGAYNIGFFYWETEGFPKSWIPFILSLDEFWSSCDLITKNLIRIGFSGKIVHVPTPVKTNSDPRMVDFRTTSQDRIKSSFKFYSIFQWNFRKGYDILIKSFLSEFSDKDDVSLIIKTNPIVGSPRREFMGIQTQIKKSLGKDSFAKIFFSDNKIDYSDICKIHSTCDCFVLPHRGEGWGIPIHEALNSCNPVITTKFGGITDYLNDENAYIIDHSMSRVTNMDWSGLYDGKIWAEPSVESLMEKMRLATEDSDFKKKQVGSKIISRNLSFSNVSSIILNRVGEIIEGSRFL